jgi:hypothetical protein
VAFPQEKAASRALGKGTFTLVSLSRANSTTKPTAFLLLQGSTARSTSEQRQ